MESRADITARHAIVQANPLPSSTCAALIGAKTPAGKTLEDDVAVAKYLLDEGHVAAVPGTAYGLSPFFRISTATSEAVLTEAVKRIAAAVAKLEF